MKWALEFGALRATSVVLGSLSPATKMRASRFLGACAARALPIRGRVIREQLAIAFPDWTEAERVGLMPAVYAHLFAFGLELMNMTRLPAERIAGQVDVGPKFRAHLEDIKASGRGAILTGGHMGNWEFAGAALVRLGMESVAVAKPMHNPMSEAFIGAARKRVGLKIVSTRQNVRPLVQCLKRGGLVALVSDQDGRAGGVFVDFFGRPASTARGTAWLAWRMGVPLLAMSGIRTPDGRIYYEAEERIDPDPAAPEETEVPRITQLFVASLERSIRQDPAQYFWFHRRWKTAPKKNKKTKTDGKPKTTPNPQPQTEPGAQVEPAAPSVETRP